MEQNDTRTGTPDIHRLSARSSIHFQIFVFPSSTMLAGYTDKRQYPVTLPADNHAAGSDNEIRYPLCVRDLHEIPLLFPALSGHTHHEKKDFTYVLFPPLLAVDTLLPNIEFSARRRVLENASSPSVSVGRIPPDTSSPCARFSIFF